MHVQPPHSKRGYTNHQRMPHTVWEGRVLSASNHHQFVEQTVWRCIAWWKRVNHRKHKWTAQTSARMCSLHISYPQAMLALSSPERAASSRATEAWQPQLQIPEKKVERTITPQASTASRLRKKSFQRWHSSGDVGPLLSKRQGQRRKTPPKTLTASASSTHT